MIVVKVIDANTARIASRAEANRNFGNVSFQSRSDWRTFDRAKHIAKCLNEEYKDEGRVYIATDAGSSVSPRYDVIEAPYVGDEVSYSFNGDSYPCGTIASISKTLKKITTTTGMSFYRRGESGSWVSNGTWTLIPSHIYEQNPSF